MTWKKASLFILLALGISLGLALSLNSWKGQVTARFERSDREIANSQAQRQTLENLDPQLLSTDNVLDQANVVWDQNDRQVLIFGNFYDRQTGMALCDIYDRVKLKFRSEGYAVSGEPVRLKYDGLCPASEVGSGFLSPFPLLDSEICALNSAIQKSEVFPGTYLDITNIDSEFPYDWALDEVAFYNESQQPEPLVFDEATIRKHFKGNLLSVSCP